MLDFNHRTTLAERIIELMDDAIIAEQEKSTHRNYLGASLIGESCQRKIQYQYFNCSRDSDKPYKAENLRICQRGHIMEPVMADWLQKAGFTLETHDADGGQFEFSLSNGRIKGHADGRIISGSEGFNYPMLWENKALSSKAWKELEKKKLAVAKPVYAAQVALYQTYFHLYENPALFTALNMDSMEIYVELLPYDAALAQNASDKAVHILKACEAGELLPRMTSDPSYYECKWCPWAERCWKASS